MSWLRFLIPSWNFFDNCSQIPFLYFRHGPGQSLGEWKMLSTSSHRSFANLFVNAQGNYLLAISSLVIKLTNEIAEKNASTPQDLKSFQMLKSAVELEVPKGSEYQFKISTMPDSQDLLISATYLKAST